VPKQQTVTCASWGAFVAEALGVLRHASGVVRSAPRIDVRLIAAAERLDERGIPIAETNRRVGALAEALGLTRPSYEQLRQAIHEARRRGRLPSTGDVLLDIAFRARPPLALGDHLAGTLPPRKRR
jgi:hypothetical protein